jgi:hypothetical protein
MEPTISWNKHNKHAQLYIFLGTNFAGGYTRELTVYSSLKVTMVTIVQNDMYFAGKWSNF